VVSRPPTDTVPPSGRLSPATMLSRVDLPQPDGPTMARNSPGATSNDTRSSAVKGPAAPWLKRRVTSRTAITGAAPAGAAVIRTPPRPGPRAPAASGAGDARAARPAG